MALPLFDSLVAADVIVSFFSPDAIQTFQLRGQGVGSSFVGLLICDRATFNDS